MFYEKLYKNVEMGKMLFFLNLNIYVHHKSTQNIKIYVKWRGCEDIKFFSSYEWICERVLDE